MNRQHIEAVRLLSDQETLSPIEKEWILQEVLPPEPQMHSQPWAPGASVVGVALAAAAAFALFVLPSATELSTRSGAAGPALEMICDPGPRCIEGSRLLFRVIHAPSEAGFFAAFAQRQDGAVLWYFPASEAGGSIRVTDDDWLDIGVELGAEHLPGEYTVHAFVTESPAGREEIKQWVETGVSPEMIKIESPLTVYPSATPLQLGGTP